jgi:hypothetical protein
MLTNSGFKALPFFARQTVFTPASGTYLLPKVYRSHTDVLKLPAFSKLSQERGKRAF